MQKVVLLGTTVVSVAGVARVGILICKLRLVDVAEVATSKMSTLVLLHGYASRWTWDPSLHDVVGCILCLDGSKLGIIIVILSGVFCGDLGLYDPCNAFYRTIVV
jgi:hypothetical protein